jgi:hypothetical protein
MADPKGALSTLDETSNTDEVVDKPTTGALSTPTKMTTTKGGAQIINPNTMSYSDPESSRAILENMQRMIEQKEKQQNSLLSAVNLASAYGSGGTEGPQRQVQAQMAQHEAGNTEIFNMRQAIAQQKAAQRQNEIFNTQRAETLGTQPGATGAGGTPGGVAVNPSATAGQPGYMSPTIRTALANAPTKADYDKVYNQWAQDQAKQFTQHQYKLKEIGAGASENTQQVYVIDGKEVPMTPNEYKALEKTGSAPPNLTPVRVATAADVAAAPTTTGRITVAADANNPSGIVTGKDANGKPIYQSFKTPQEGVLKTQELINTYLTGQGPMKGVQVTPSNVVGMWAQGNPSTGSSVAEGNYLKSVISELKSNGIQVGPNDSIPNTPEAQKALANAIIKFESGKNASKFLPLIGAQAPSTAATAPVSGGQNAPTTAAFDPKTIPGYITKPATPKDFELNRKLLEEYSKSVTEPKLKENIKLAEAEAGKKGEYLTSVGNSQGTYNKLEDLLNVTKGNASVFNLSGQGLKGPIISSLVASHDEVKNPGGSPNDRVAQWTLNNEKQTQYRNAKQGAAEAQAEWAKNLVSGAGGRLTNADLNLGGVAKGVGPDTTYESHMRNLAKQMELARVIYHRGVEFEKWAAKHPNEPVTTFENSDYYKNGSKRDAAMDVGKLFSDVKEANYVQRDKNGKPYVIVNGKGVYL